MSVEMNFDATTVAPATGEYEPLPNNTYPFAIVASESKVSEDKTKMGLKLTLQVLDGDQKGKKMTVYLNLQHPNQQAVEIAQKELSAICHVTGVMKLQNSQQLHDKPFQAKVKVTPPQKKMVDGVQKEFGAGNAVVQYLKIDGTPLGVVNGGAPKAAATPAPRKQVPWAQPKSA